MRMWTLYLLLSFFPHSILLAAPVDIELQKLVNKFKMKPLIAVENKFPEQVKLGERLFFDTLLSGNKNISCSSCHQPDKGTSDGLPLSLGQGATGVGNNRRQGQGSIIRRNSPALYNLGQSEWFRMFWDGRVQIGLKSKALFTPNADLNGSHPLRADIVALLDSVLAAQVLFPMINPAEMMGGPLQNEVAAQTNPNEQWNALATRFRSNGQYWDAFQRAFPILEKNPNNFNIGFVAKALSQYIANSFQATNSPWDQYLRGDNQALSEKQKQGALLFMGKAKCAICHQGSLLTDQAFENVGAPQIGPQSWKDRGQDDFGRFEVELNGWSKEAYRYSFRVPPLRNVALSAPYMHDGAFLTLEEVVNHYDNPKKSIDDYDGSLLNQRFGEVYNEALTAGMSDESRSIRHKNLSPKLKDGLALSNEERLALVHFLKTALTDRNEFN